MFNGEINLKNRKIPRLLLGTSPFIGAGQFGAKASYYYSTLYKKPHNMYKIIKKSWEIGVKGIQLLPYKPIIKALEMAIKDGCEMKIVGTIRPNTELEDIELLDDLEAESMILHASLVDGGNFNYVETLLKKINDKGAIAGLATHVPYKTTKRILNSSIRKMFDIYMLPFNSLGYLMDRSIEEIENLIERLNKKIIAKKVLAAGKLEPKEALNYLKLKKCVDIVTVGVASPNEAKETFNVFLGKY